MQSFIKHNQKKWSAVAYSWNLRYGIMYSTNEFVTSSGTASFDIALEAPVCITFFVMRDCMVWTQGVNRSGHRARVQINRWRHRATLIFVALNSLVPHHGTVLTNTRQTLHYFLITLSKIVRQMPANDTVKSPIWGGGKIEYHNFKGDWNITKNVHARRSLFGLLLDYFPSSHVHFWWRHKTLSDDRTCKPVYACKVLTQSDIWLLRYWHSHFEVDDVIRPQLLSVTLQNFVRW